MKNPVDEGILESRDVSSGIIFHFQLGLVEYTRNYKDGLKFSPDTKP